MSDDLKHSIRENPEPQQLPGPSIPDVPEPDPIQEIFGPTAAMLRDAASSRIVIVALTSEALWIQETYLLRKILLRDLGGATLAVSGSCLSILMQTDSATERLELKFSLPHEALRWNRELEAARQAPPPHGDIPPASKGVALVKKAPNVPQQFLGTVQFVAADRRHADRGAQLRAGLMGADALIGVERRRRAELGIGGTQVSGTAVRVKDPTERRLLRYRWFAEEVHSLVNRALLILAAQMVVIVLLDAMHYFGWSGITRAETLAGLGKGLALFYSWPLLLLALLRFLKWPQLLRAAGLAVLAATVGRWLTVIVAHAIAKAAVSDSGPRDLLISFADPINLPFALLGVWNCRMAWRLASESRFMLPPGDREAAAPRLAWSRPALALSAIACAAMLGYVGVVRYRLTSYGSALDPKRESEALQAFNEGAAQANRNDRTSAEVSFQRSLRIWEELTANPSAPVHYHIHKAHVLYNLGWLAQANGRIELAESYFSRALGAGEPYANRPEATDDFRNLMADARRYVANVHEFEATRKLDEMEKQASRKYEEADVKWRMGGGDAEAPLHEAIALWEEILPKAKNPDYVKGAQAQLAAAHLFHADILMQKGNNRDAAKALRQSIDHGEKALQLDPDRALIKHNLDVARKNLEQLRKGDG